MHELAAAATVKMQHGAAADLEDELAGQ